jgi:hypothetical protein
MGAPIFTRDGAAIGEVQEVRGESFEVSSPRTASYWLSREFVARSAASCVELDFDAEALNDYKLDHPVPVRRDAPT